MVWLVLAPGGVGTGALAGSYVRGTASAAVGAKGLLGDSHKQGDSLDASQECGR